MVLMFTLKKKDAFTTKRHWHLLKYKVQKLHVVKLLSCLPQVSFSQEIHDSSGAVIRSKRVMVEQMLSKNIHLSHTKYYKAISL